MGVTFNPISVSAHALEPRRITRERHAFNDIRLFHRWLELSHQMEQQQKIVLHKVASSYAQSRSYYRFVNNDRVSPAELIRMSCQIDQNILSGRHVLLVGDTTSINLKKQIEHIQDPENLGVLEDNKTPGFFIHAHLAVDAQTEHVLGLADQLLWCRPASEPDSKPDAEWSNRESYKWYMGAKHAVDCCRAAQKKTIVLDREADIKDLFEQFSQWPETYLVIRNFRKRKVWWQNQLVTTEQCLDQSPLLGAYELKLPALDHYSKTNGKRIRRKARQAQIEVRSCALKLPMTNSGDPNKPGIELYLVEAREVNAPVLEADESPILWRLFTTHPVESFEQATTIIGFYCCRWTIEQLFRLIKKQGLNLEATRLETVKAIFTQAIMAIKTASRTLQLVYARDSFDPQPIQEVFEPHEIEVLEKLNQQFQGTTQKQQNPHPIDQISWAAWIIARLGGWKGYQSQRPPGPLTFKWGLEQFHIYLKAYLLFKESG